MFTNFDIKNTRNDADTITRLSKYSEYKDLYDEYYQRNSFQENREKYVAPLYDHLLSKGGEIYISIIPEQKVHVLGTPEELKSFNEK